MLKNGHVMGVEECEDAMKRVHVDCEYGGDGAVTDVIRFIAVRFEPKNGVCTRQF